MHCTQTSAAPLLTHSDYDNRLVQPISCFLENALLPYYQQLDVAHTLIKFSKKLKEENSLLFALTSLTIKQILVSSELGHWDSQQVANFPVRSGFILPHFYTLIYLAYTSQLSLFLQA